MLSLVASTLAPWLLATMHSFHIYRYDPDTGQRPRMQAMELEVGTADRMLLDVLTRLKAIHPSLSLRRSCRQGICGSDAMNSSSPTWARTRWPCGLMCHTSKRRPASATSVPPRPQSCRRRRA
jgi:succinate dehydrogenase / fumarate reductase iron-sulfur subunit